MMSRNDTQDRYPIISCKDVHKWYGDYHALRGSNDEEVPRAPRDPQGASRELGGLLQSGKFRPANCAWYKFSTIVYCIWVCKSVY